MTPLAKTLKALHLSQTNLAERLHINQGTLSKAITNGCASKQMAERIVTYLDPERTLLNEMMLLYPERYENWQFPDTAEKPTLSNNQQDSKSA